MNLNLLQNLIAEILIIHLNWAILSPADQQLSSCQCLEINHSLQPTQTLHNPKIIE
jgi:hypothetical protein